MNAFVANRIMAAVITLIYAVGGPALFARMFVGREMRDLGGLAEK